jgi:hypothetical protein
MKTSTKLLIVFFIALPTTLFAYNWLMKRQYLAGNLMPEEQPRGDEISDSVNYVKKPLPQCKYVVVSGEISSGDIVHGNYSAFWSNYRNIFIHGNHQGKQLALVNRYYESLFKTKLSNDTLYLYFYRKKRIGNISSINSNLLGLYLNSGVEYIKAEMANFSADGSFNLKHMRIDAMPGATFSVNGLRTTELNLTAKGEAKLTLNGAKGIAVLSYSLLDSATARFDNCQVTAYKPLHIDTAAKMDITIKGNAIQQYLSAKQ